MGKIAEAENVRLITTDRYRNKQPCKMDWNADLSST